MGPEISVYVIRAGGGEDGLVLSLARAEEEHDWTDAERLLDSQETLHGTVAGYNKGGLIVKLGHLRGFIPASQVSLSRRRRAEGETPDKRWGKMVGEPIVAKVIEVDRRRNRLILSERAAAREARKVLKEQLITELKAGEIRSGHVISLADFGAFVDIGGADGLVHLSEISWQRIAHPKDAAQGRAGSAGQGAGGRPRAQAHQPVDARARARSVADDRRAAPARGSWWKARSPS